MSRRPRLLDASLNEVARLNPQSMSVELQLEATSTATMELSEDDETIRMHDMIEVFTPRRSAGIFRATDIADTKRGTRTITLMHGIDTLSDSVWSGETDYDGTVAGFLGALLAQQPVPRWQLGTCADPNDWKRAGINYDRLSELLEEVRKQEYGYYFAYDFTTTPWTLHFLAQGETVTSEFRLERNIENCEITQNDEEQCNRLYLSVNEKTESHGVTVTDTEIKTYENAASQAVYGIIEKTADIDLENVPDADVWAADFLSRRAHPWTTIVIDGYALESITGEDWDEARLGEKARVALPDYAEALEERVTSVKYPELIFDDGTGKPVERVTVQLANSAPSFSETIASLKKETKKTAKAGRAGGRGGASAEELENWAIVTQHHGEVMDESGVTELYESGIVVDAVEGITLYSLAQGFISQHSEVKIQRDRISLVVEGSGDGATIKAASIVASINDSGSQVNISADKILLDGATSIDNLLTGRASISRIWATTADIGNLSILPGGSLSLGNSELIVERHSAGWRTATVVESVSITDASVSVSSEKRFLVATSSSDLTPHEYVQGRLVTGHTNGAHVVTPLTIYYLGSLTAP